MNIDDLTYGDLKKIAQMFAAGSEVAPKHEKRAVVVCTDKRGVVFGYCDNVGSRPINLSNAPMCLYWSADVGGVFGLAENGPTASCKISAEIPDIALEGVTAIMSVSPIASSAWASSKVQGR